MFIEENKFLDIDVVNFLFNFHFIFQFRMKIMRIIVKIMSQYFLKMMII